MSRAELQSAPTYAPERVYRTKTVQGTRDGDPRSRRGHSPTKCATFEWSYTSWCPLAAEPLGAAEAMLDSVDERGEQ